MSVLVAELINMSGSQPGIVGSIHLLAKSSSIVQATSSTYSIKYCQVIHYLNRINYITLQVPSIQI